MNVDQPLDGSKFAPARGGPLTLTTAGGECEGSRSTHGTESTQVCERTALRSQLLRLKEQHHHRASLDSCSASEVMLPPAVEFTFRLTAGNPHKSARDRPAQPTRAPQGATSPTRVGRFMQEEFDRAETKRMVSTQGMGADAPPRSRTGSSPLDTPHLRESPPTGNWATGAPAEPLQRTLRPGCLLMGAGAPVEDRILLRPRHLCMSRGPVRVRMSYRRVKSQGMSLAAPLMRPPRRVSEWQDPASWTRSGRGVWSCGWGAQRRSAPGADTIRRPATLLHHVQASPPSSGTEPRDPLSRFPATSPWMMMGPPRWLVRSFTCLF